MPSNASIILYHTDACHLCELAAELLDTAKVSYRMIDICDDQSLVEEYGIRIPVVKLVAAQTELNWPFDLEALEHFLGA
ncbi:glutaredoxin family protein [Shewanella fidelis]|uniref:Glutaredoxin family protein n=1 Tax=Shewanella fidelis TaxID=173509 RepID=A0AAW8NLV5_9GAMM|nr:glutaredoxin family protein [Shewanella fidelis]MDR8523681.1 glutaredoxin family protein [Shewanella fidelis]MDW4810228.1 glutaredoxin family protein [Shewanella fidelis]MDW4814373.1 glutaredoxin family protein [Shewanella fidelis]MDW4818464.1 glutaredoxin family protein [Shewanella fidelis]MDW4823884.1 glutaredoxin family protein [Shewanella fidelis]